MDSDRPDQTSASAETPGDERLDSWKEVAAYLKREVRTLHRWEAQEELPIHRHLHKERGSVYAYKSELDSWWNNRRTVLERRPIFAEVKVRPWRLRLISGVASLAVVLAGTTYLATHGIWPTHAP